MTVGFRSRQTAAGLAAAALLVTAAPVTGAEGPANEGTDGDASASLLERDDALEDAVEHNYDLDIAETQLGIADRNAGVGNADFLPDIRAVADQRHQFGGSGMFGQSQFFSQTSFGVEATWMLFDGLGRFSKLDRLKVEREAVELERAAAIEETVFEVAVAYNDVVRQRELLEAYRQTRRLSERRLAVARSRREAGTGSEVDVNLARVELFRDRSAVAEQKIAVTEAKTELNRLLGRPPDRRFRVESEMEVERGLTYERAVERAIGHNPRILAAQKRLGANEQRVDEARADRWPDVELSLGYSYNEFHNGFSPNFDETPGLEYGTTLSIPLFDGFAVRRSIRNARSERTIQKTRLARRKTDLRKQVRDAHEAYRRHLDRVSYADEAVEIADRNIDTAMAELEAGTATQVELRNVQLNRRDAHSRLIEARYRAKRAELKLRQLMGELYDPN